jgi:hypothetical protein
MTSTDFGLADGNIRHFHQHARFNKFQEPSAFARVAAFK